MFVNSWLAYLVHAAPLPPRAMRRILHIPNLRHWRSLSNFAVDSLRPLTGISVHAITSWVRIAPSIGATEYVVGRKGIGSARHVCWCRLHCTLPSNQIILSTSTTVCCMVYIRHVGMDREHLQVMGSGGDRIPKKAMPSNQNTNTFCQVYVCSTKYVTFRNTHVA